MSTNNSTAKSLITDETAAESAAAHTGDPATGLLLVSVWGGSHRVMTAMVNNESLAPGARERAAEKLAALSTGDQR